MAGPTSSRDNKIVIKTAATFINRYPFSSWTKHDDSKETRRGARKIIIAAISLIESSPFFLFFFWGWLKILRLFDKLDKFKKRSFSRITTGMEKLIFLSKFVPWRGIKITSEKWGGGKERVFGKINRRKHLYGVFVLFDELDKFKKIVFSNNDGDGESNFSLQVRTVTWSQNHEVRSEKWGGGKERVFGEINRRRHLYRVFGGGN